jgi:DNA gyrase/topoisomerase IV subunit A
MQQSSNYILNISRDYALYVCENRAVPQVTDGLKHGQRMALWVLRDKADKIKTIALSGLMSYLRLYVHGDVSCSNAIGLLAAPYKNNLPLIEGLGEFGSRVSPDAIGAPRYTECRRSKAAQAFLYNDLDIVPLEDNYDGSTQQPKHFLPLIPVVLLNGVSGIAVGWSTNILPRSLKSLVEATKQALLGQPIKPLAPHYDRYDITVAPLGPNQWEFTGRAKIIDTSTVQITELPPGVGIEAFRRRLIEMEEAEQIQGYTDRSTETINITVKLKRGSIAKWRQQTAIDTFKLKERVTERIVVIDWNGKAIRTYDSAEALVKDFAQWRLGWYTTRFEFNKRRDSYELIFWLALKALFESPFPKRLGGFTDRASLQAEVVATVVKKAKLTLDTGQIDRIVSLPTYRWTQEFAEEVERMISKLRDLISDHEAILASPERLRAEYLTELDHLKKL